MHAGADWIEEAIGPCSEFGRRVADLLVEWQAGIYHLDTKALKRVNWTDPRLITLTVRFISYATFDGSYLTRLVFLAHDACIRVELEAVGPRCMRIWFHPRKRDGHLAERHPTLEEAVTRWRECHPIAEAAAESPVNGQITQLQKGGER
jgi:hypothetical protein